MIFVPHVTNSCIIITREPWIQMSRRFKHAKFHKIARKSSPSQEGTLVCVLLHRRVGRSPRACLTSEGTHDFCWSLFRSHGIFLPFLNEKKLFMLWCMTHCLVILIVFGCTQYIAPYQSMWMGFLRIWVGSLMCCWCEWSGMMCCWCEWSGISNCDVVSLRDVHGVRRCFLF